MGARSSHKKTILVVEDERPLLHAIKTKLEESEFEVITARKVSQAENYLEEIEGVDILWIDHYLLGKETGIQLVADVKNDPKFQNIPIFVVSNTATPEKEQAYIQLGVTEYCTKADYKLTQIIDKINEYLEENK